VFLYPEEWEAFTAEFDPEKRDDISCERLLSEYRTRRTTLSLRRPMGGPEGKGGRRRKVECRDDSEEMLLAAQLAEEATKNPKRLPVSLVEGGITMSQINTVTTGASTVQRAL